MKMIEFLVLHKNKNYIYYLKSYRLNHNHNYKNNIIYQPELSDIIFFAPNNKR